jgi:ABC-type sugar transport system ATPase subunit
VAERPTSTLDLRGLAALMVGTELVTAERFEQHFLCAGPPILELQNLSVAGRGPISLSLNPGEILGVAGLVGSGRSRLARAVVGEGRATGVVRLGGTVRHFHSPADAAAAGILFLPEDRKRDGLVLPSSVASNLVLSALGRSLSRFGLIRSNERAQLVGRLIDRFRILPPDPERPVRTLSGGNQQKVLLARAFAAKAKVLILDQPTAGVDVGAKIELYEQIVAMARSGVGVIVISDDLDELLLLSQRIAVMHGRRLVGIEGARTFNRRHLLEAITTGRIGQAA